MSEPSVKLSSGHSIPLNGFGTWKAEPNVVGAAVEAAIDAGYRHFDCAAIYCNEKEVGAALTKKFAEGKITREQIFVTSKLWNTCREAHNVRKHCEITLKELNLQYLDLYLIHWPVAFEYTGETIKPESFKQIPVSIRETWTEMEKLVEAGLVRSIGVSNFNVQNLIELLSYSTIKPAVNQVELHPFLSQPQLKKFSDKHNIHLTAYSPLGNGAFTEDATVGEIAKKYNKTIPNILVRWNIQKNISCIPKSSTPSRIVENFNVDFEINEADMLVLDNLNKNLRTCNPAVFWDIPLFD